MFALSTEARLTNVSINKEKAGEDNGRSAVVLDLVDGDGGDANESVEQEAAA